MTDPNTAASSTPPVKPPNIVRRLYNWVLSWAQTPYGTPALFVISFVESSFFPIPPDVLQIALSVARPRRAFFYAAVSVVASVLGGLLGWWIGSTLWDSVSAFFFEYVPGFTEQNYALVEAKYKEHAFLAIFTAAFTPIPYKVFTIASGVFHVALSTLICASILGRGGRFFLVASAIFFFGPTVKTWLEKYFELATLVLLVIGALGFVAVKYML
ncbi:MAG: DedA family protein [Planctomycetes bacterium]|nr:DedA family protein [Planctomycetota bacterium]